MEQTKASQTIAASVMNRDIDQNVLKEIYDRRENITLAEISILYGQHDLVDIVTQSHIKACDLITRREEGGCFRYEIAWIVPLAMLLKDIEVREMDDWLEKKWLSASETVANSVRWRLRIINEEIQALQHILILYIRGFDNVARHIECPPTVNKTTFEWVKRVSGSTRGIYLAPVFAVAVVASLERFMRIIANDLAKAPNQKAKQAWRHWKKSAQRNIPIDEFLERHLTPLAKEEGGTWANRIKTIFGEFNEDAMLVIYSLLTYRHRYTHSNRPLLESVPVAKGDLIKAWMVAVMWFAQWVLTTLEDMAGGDHGERG